MPNHVGIDKWGLLVFLIGFCGTISAQIDYPVYTPHYQDTTIIAHLGDIESSTGVSLSYSTSQFDAYAHVTLPVRSLSITEAISYLLGDYKFALIERSNNKLIISVKEVERAPKDMTVKGVVLDRGSNEQLYGATIYHMGNNRGTYSNDFGYFSLSNVKVGDILRFSYIGYSDEFITIDTADLKVLLSPAAEVSTIIIKEILSEYINADTGGDVLDIGKSTSKFNILGEKDILHMARQKPGVYSGSEGVSGLIVRGGSQDQNLMLFEDVPMYAVNHMADISSIFMEDAIRDAQLIRGGFPSRYSGRLSSVLEVRLKDGNQEKVKGSVSAGLPGVKAFLEGPIGDKASFMVGGRISWINAYIDPLIQKFSVFDNLDLDFHDFVAKYTYRFSNTSSLSISGYKGGDDVNVDKNQIIVRPDDPDESFSSVENVGFGWNNELVSAKYSAVLSNKWLISANAGLLHYEYRSRSSYDFISIINDQIVDNDRRLVNTSSDIVNILSGIEADYFLNADHKIKIGASYNQHRFSPKIEQSITDVNLGEPTIDSDSITVGNELSFYVEDTYSPTKKIVVYGGLNYSTFGVRGTSYSYLQPRFKITHKPQKAISLTMTASRMVQFVHLLVNNGLGLPSDLWVPSTDEIAPEISDQFSFTVKTDLGNDNVFSIGGFIKRQQNVILYRDPQDLYSTILNDSNSEVNYINDRDWERRIETGQRNISGLEVALYKSRSDWQYNLSYTRSIGTNRFDNLNQGNAFTDRYDRPHDLNLSTSYQINDKWNVGLQWIYGSGNTFSLPLLEVPTTVGVSVVTQDVLNNYRMPAYHHLDFLANYDNTNNGEGFKASFGIYNIYNRYNPYYLYIFEDNISESIVFKKLSLFPFLPHFNLTYEF